MSTQTYELVTIEAIRAAAARIANIAVKTPLVRAPFPDVKGEVWLKAESLQPIGAFKLRGAANKILQLTPEEIRRGVITYSSGNHAQGVAYAAREVGAKAVIVMPSNAPAIKRAATLAMGAEVVDVGLASSERLAMAEKLASVTRRGRHRAAFVLNSFRRQDVAALLALGFVPLPQGRGRMWLVPGVRANTPEMPPETVCHIDHWRLSYGDMDVG